MHTKRREISVRNEPYIYKIENYNNGKWQRKCFRVQKKIKGLDGNRKNISSTFETLKEAREFRDSIENKTKEDLPQIRKRLRPCKFSDVFQRFLDHKKFEVGLQNTTLQTYEKTGRHLKFFNSLDFDQIDSYVVDRWADFLRDPEYQKLQQSTRINYQHEFDLFRGVANYYLEFENEDYRNPIRKRHKIRLCSRPRNSKKQIRFLNVEQQERLVHNLDSLIELNPKNDLARLMRIQLETGLRVGEVSALQKEQINFANRQINVDRHLQWDRAKGGATELAKGTKGGRSRVVLMSRECMRVLKLNFPFEPKAKIFNIKGDWIKYRQAQHFYRKQIEEAGSTAFGTHTMRHTFAVNFLRKTKDIHALQKLLGHADLTETQGYAKYSDESTLKAFELFDGEVLDVDFEGLAHKVAHND